MNRVTRRRWLAMSLSVLAGAVAYGAGDLLWDGDERPRFEAVTARSARERIQERHLPNVPLVTHDGERVRFYDDLVKDRNVVLTFVSGDAPAMSRTVMHNLGAIQRVFGSRVGDDTFLYSITRTPQRDTPTVLFDWAVHSGAGRGWKFLTGTPADVEHLRRGLGFASPDPREDADPAYAIGILRYGVEREMRWGHCQSQGPARVLAHSMLLDFGVGPARTASPIASTFGRGRGVSAQSAPIWNCRLLRQIT